VNARALRQLWIAPALLFLFSAAAGPAGLAQTQHFDILFQGKEAGSASFSTEKAADGYHNISTGSVKLPNLTYSFSKSERVDMGLNLVSANISAVVNGSAVNVVVEVAPDGRYSMETSANGQKYPGSFDRHDHSVLVPDLDPGAMQTLVSVARAVNNRDLRLLIPKQSGQLLAARITTLPDQKGSWNGQDVSVHHLQVGLGEGFADLFVAQDGNFLQEEIPQQGLAMIRIGFRLTPAAKAGPPQ
jgi:hypothetical protein